MKFKTSSAIIIFTNVLSFMTMQTIFFWFIVSRSIDKIVLDKSILIKSIAKDNYEFDYQIRKYLNTTEFKNDYNQGLAESILRQEYNINLLWNWMTLPFSVIIGFLILNIIVELAQTDRSKKFDKIDFLILLSVFTAFLSEVVFYFVIINRSRIILDTDLFIFMVKNYDFFKLLGFEFELPTFGPNTIVPLAYPTGF